jgi:hypothetical protein
MLGAALDGGGQAVRVELPGGIWQDELANAPVRELAVRPVGADDEVFLLATATSTSPSQRATALLARCLADQADGEELARSLRVGDREALLLHLRRITLGDRLDCVLRCPSPDCSEQMELQLRARDLLLPPYPDVRREYEVRLETEGDTFDVVFRLPTADDLDRAAATAREDPERGARQLLEICVAHVSQNGREVAVESLPLAIRQAVSSAMAERDSQAVLELELVCPVCGCSFTQVFDTAAFFLQELDERATRLLQEVHLLAWHYHWGETEILRMPAHRRARYIEMVANAVARTRVP